MVRKVKTKPPPIADEIAVHIFVETGLLPDHFPVPRAARGIATQRTMYAKGRSALEVPPPPFEPGRLVGVHACRAEVDEVAGKGAFQGTALGTAKILSSSNLHCPQITVARKVLVKAPAPKAVDAPVHLVLYKGPQILIKVGPFFPQVAALF